MDNIAEGFDDGAVKEFLRFLRYAQRSCSEVQSQLYRASDCGYIDGKEFDDAYKLAGSCRRQIKGFRKYLADNARERGVAEEAGECTIGPDETTEEGAC
jgi:four helix bundle protein